MLWPLYNDIHHNKNIVFQYTLLVNVTVKDRALYFSKFPEFNIRKIPIMYCRYKESPLYKNNIHGQGKYLTNTAYTSYSINNNNNKKNQF